MTGIRGKDGTNSACHSIVRAGSDAVESAMLHAAGADAAVENKTGSTGDPARLIRLPPFLPNENTVIEYEATVMLSLSLSLLIALSCTIQEVSQDSAINARISCPGTPNFLWRALL